MHVCVAESMGNQQKSILYMLVQRFVCVRVTLTICMSTPYISSHFALFK